MDACNCEFQSGLCGFCSGAAVKALNEAPANARRLKVWLATKRVPEAVRAEWQRQLDRELVGV